jgi:hypothetical protein
MGRRDEDDPAHLGKGLVAEHLPQEPAVLGRAGDLLDGLLADRLPKARSASLHHHLRQDAAQAVADDDHPVEGRVRAVGIEDPASAPQGLPEQVGREGDGVTTCVAETPELVSSSDCGVGLEVLDHPGP